MKVTASKRLCRAGIIASLYVVFTYVFAPISFGVFQVRPAEALCLLPLFFPESIPALVVGCAISNLASPYVVYDLIFGTLATLLAAMGTYFIGVLIKNGFLRVLLGGLFPVALNALVVPVIIVYVYGVSGHIPQTVAYWLMVGWVALTEAVWVYALGGMLYAVMNKLIKT